MCLVTHFGNEQSMNLWTSPHLLNLWGTLAMLKACHAWNLNRKGERVTRLKKKIKLNSTTQLVTITCEFNNSFLSSAWNFLCYLMKPVYIHSKKELNNNLATFLSGLHHMLPDPACNDSSVHADQQNLAPIYYETVNINIFTPCKI